MTAPLAAQLAAERRAPRSVSLGADGALSFVDANRGSIADPRRKTTLALGFVALPP
jgi:hypothetical protein